MRTQKMRTFDSEWVDRTYMRKTAIRDLAKNGWDPQQIAEAFGWKLSYVNQVIYPAEYPPWMELPGELRDNEFSVRTENAIGKLGISTYRELAEKLDELSATRGVGKKTMREITDELSRRGLLNHPSGGSTTQ